MFASGVVLGAALVFFSYPSGVLALCRDAREMPTLLARMKADAERRQVLNQKVAAMKCRMDLKDRLIAELISGRATLAEVSEQFHELNAAYPPCMQMIRHRYPGRDDGECVALNVIEFVRLNDMTDDQRGEVEARLGSQFYAAFGHENPAGEPLVRAADTDAGERATERDGPEPVHPSVSRPGGDRGELLAARGQEVLVGPARVEVPAAGTDRWRRGPKARGGSAP